MNKGFTLIELLVVVLIIGILSAVALPQYTTAVEKARSTEAVTLMGNMRHALERYRLQSTEWPTANSFADLDIEFPDNKTDAGIQTKNFSITFNTSGNGVVITAARVGSQGYNLYMAVNSKGEAKRYCGTTAPTLTNDTFTNAQVTANSAAEKMCKAITSGHATDGNW